MSEKSAEILLVLNSCEGLVQAVLAARPEPGAPWRALKVEEREAASQGAEILAPLLGGMFAGLGLPVTALTHVVATRGPGSFTGLRLSLATAAGLARAVGARQAGLDYLPLLALSAALRLELAFPAPTLPGPARLNRPGLQLWVATHARRNLVQAQAFVLPDKADEGALPQSLTDILVLSPEELVAHMAGQAQRAAKQARGQSPMETGTEAANVGAGGAAKAKAGPAADAKAELADDAETRPAPTAGAGPILLGSGLGRNRETFAAAFASEPYFAAAPPVLASDAFNHPLPEALLLLAGAAVFSDQDIVPIYARPSDAEQNLGHIAANLGLDPSAAEKKLAELTGADNLLSS